MRRQVVNEKKRGTMKVITIKQPWATLIVDGVKAAPVGTQLLRAQAGLIREGTEVQLATPAAGSAPPAASN